MAGNLYFHGRKQAREDFQRDTRKLAQYFKSQGLRPDDVIAILMRNDIQFLMIAEAARLVGLRYVALNWHGVTSELISLIDDAKAKMLLGHADLLPNIIARLDHDFAILSVDVPAEISALYPLSSPGSLSAPSDTLGLSELLLDLPEYTGTPEKFRGMYAFTSGSTGKPKGIMRAVDQTAPDRWLSYQGLSKVLMQEETGDRFYCAAPLYHSAPNALSVISLSVGNVDVFLDAKFDPEGFLQTVEKFSITHAYIVPTMMIRLLKLDPVVRAKYKVSSLRYMVSTGSPCPIDVKKDMIDWFGPILFESYGASEIGFMTLISSQEALKKPGSVGRILEGGSVIVLDDDGREVPAGQVGTLYMNLPIFGPYEYTNIDGDKDAHRSGAHSTVGDMGYVDEEGYIFISDRKKDMIISGGANIFPAEIEAQMILMPEIVDCAVFGAPDAEFGEVIIAAVQTKDGINITLEQLQNFLTDRLAKFKIPRVLDLHNTLPRQDSGKIFKAKLREPYWKKEGRQV